MQNLIKFISACFLALALMTVAGCASTSEQEGSGEYVDDSVITMKVKAQLFDEPNLRSGQVNVETYKGVVQLSGLVSSEADMDTAVEVARRVPGVKSVKNDMWLK